MENDPNKKEPKFSTMDKIVLPIIGVLGFVFWAGTHPDQFIDLSLKLNKAWESALIFLLTPIK